MPARRKQRQRSQLLVMFLLLLAVLFLLTAAALVLTSKKGEEPVDYPDVENMDPDARPLEETLLTGLFGIRPNKADEFSYKMRDSLSVDAESGRAEALITNPAENACLMSVEIVLSGSDEVIYRSGYLKPNTRIDEITLFDIPEAGEYTATVYFCAVSFDTFDLLGILEEEVPLTVK